MRLIAAMNRARLPAMTVAAIALALAGCSGGKDDAKRARPPMLVAVNAASAEDFTPQLVALGTVTPLQSVAVRTRIDGQITAVLFDEGSNVRAGQPLFRLDDRAVRADIAQGRATLAGAQANAAQASADLNRAQQLVSKGFVSKATLDIKRAAAQSGRATIDGARAAMTAAQTTLSYLTIRAPVSGRTGEIGFKLGATVRASDATPLVTVNQLSPITVRFLVPPEQIQPLRSAMATGALTVSALAPAGAADAPPLATGRLTFLDNNVDPGNGSVAAKAEFDNRGDALWPGAIVNIRLPLGAAVARIALPEGAVQTGRDNPFVWTVGGDGKVAMRDVTVAGRFGGRVYLAGGVKPGEQIVVDGLTSKLKPGDTVRTKPRGDKGGAPRLAAAG